MGIPARLISFALLLLFWAIPVQAAGTPEQALLQYYEQARNEDLEKYYQVQYTADLTAGDLAARKEITRELWKRFDTREATVQNFRVVQENDLAIARYNLVSILIGPADSGDGILQQYKEYAAAFIRQGNDWKVAQVSDAKEFDSSLQAIFRIRASRALLAESAALANQPDSRPSGGVKPAAAPQPAPKAPPDIFSGTWGTTYGELVLVKTDGKLAGSYENKDGRLSGEIAAGNVVRGYWTEVGNRCPEARDGRKTWGDFEFNFTDSGGFTGKWGYCGGGMNSSWSGQRKSAAVPVSPPSEIVEAETPAMAAAIKIPAPAAPVVSPPAETPATAIAPPLPAVRPESEKKPQPVPAPAPPPETPPSAPAAAPAIQAGQSPGKAGLDTLKPKPNGAEQEDIFSGIWATNYGELSLQRADGQVTGKYTSNGGAIIGTVEEGAVVSGYWTENGRANRCPTERDGRANWGRFEFKFTPEGAFSGKWGYCDKPLSGDWSGTVKSRPVPVVQPTIVLDRPLTRWKLNSGELITLQHQGNTFEGTYAQDHGEVFGSTTDNRSFTGYWIEDMSNERCKEPLRGRFYWGTFAITFNDDRTFNGKWGYCNGPRLNDWSGKGL